MNKYENPKLFGQWLLSESIHLGTNPSYTYLFWDHDAYSRQNPQTPSRTFTRTFFRPYSDQCWVAWNQRTIRGRPLPHISPPKTTELAEMAYVNHFINPHLHLTRQLVSGIQFIFDPQLLNWFQRYLNLTNQLRSQLLPQPPPTPYS